MIKLVNRSTLPRPEPQVRTARPKIRQTQDLDGERKGEAEDPLGVVACSRISERGADSVVVYRMSVFSVLHDIQNTLAVRFPVAEAGKLHPYLRNASSKPWVEERQRLLASVRELRDGVERFRASWQGRTAGDDADAVEQKKTVLLRIMADW